MRTRANAVQSRGTQDSLLSISSFKTIFIWAWSPEQYHHCQWPSLINFNFIAISIRNMSRTKKYKNKKEKKEKNTTQGLSHPQAKRLPESPLH